MEQCSNCPRHHYDPENCYELKRKKEYSDKYNSIHAWNLDNWTKTGICEFCHKEAKTQWANKSQQYIKRDRADWLELCQSCHQRYDHANPTPRRIKST